MIRKAPPDEHIARLFSEMILDSAEYFPLIFGPSIYDVLTKLFIRERNLFSYRHVKVLEYENDIAAMILAYDFHTKKSEGPRTGRLLARYLHFAMVMRFRRLWKFNVTVGRLDAGDWYISNIAVFEKYRRRGFARELMIDTEKDAEKHNAKFLTLDVEKANHAAINLYKSLGFSGVNEFQIKIGRHNFIELMRMKKPLF